MLGFGSGVPWYGPVRLWLGSAGFGKDTCKDTCKDTDNGEGEETVGTNPSI